MRFEMLRRAGLASVLICLLGCQSAPLKTGELTSSPSSNPALRPEDQLIDYQGPATDYRKGDLMKVCDQALGQTEAALDKIAALAPGERTFANVQLAFESAMTGLSNRLGGEIFMDAVTPNSDLSADSLACEKKTNQFYVGVFTRKDLYQALLAVHPTNDDEARLQHETLLGFEENGLKLPDPERGQVKTLMEKITANEADFSRNLNQDNTTVTLSKDELAGVPQPDIDRLKKSGDNYILTTKYSDLDAVLNNATSEDARKKMYMAFVHRAAPANVQLLADTVVLREQAAHILGFRNWADYRLQDRMAKSAANVWHMLNALKVKLAKRDRRDLMVLRRAKRRFTHDPRAQLYAWDISFYDQLMRKQKYSVDEEQLRDYFPKDYVVKAIFKIYSTLLGVKFEKIENARVWAPLVEEFRVRDAATGAIDGYIFTDLFPRPGKYGHAATFPLRAGYLGPNGYVKPVSAIVTNFNPPSKDRPSLLSHDEVETFFHEFGHLMHQVLTKAPYGSLSGSNVKQDFVEAPSQMLEEWVWQPEILHMISHNYKTGEPLPESMIQKMIRARQFDKGYFYTRQLMLATYDMRLHTARKPVDVASLYEDLYKKIIGLDATGTGSWVAGFGHLMGGYDAGYYGYLWSEVYAADMFSEFKRHGLLNPRFGARYRHWILEKGDMQNPMVLLTHFLGRPPNEKAFLKKLELK